MIQVVLSHFRLSRDEVSFQASSCDAGTVSEMHRKNDRFATADQLMQMLSSADHFERAEAARQLCNMGNEAIRALPALLALYDDSWYQVRIQVPRAMIRMEARQDEAAEVLNKLLDDENEIVRLYAKEAQRVLVTRT